MTKLAQAKLKQGYVSKAQPRTCMHCTHYKMDRMEVVNGFDLSRYNVDRHLRCGLGGFKVMKMGTCNLWERKLE